MMLLLLLCIIVYFSFSLVMVIIFSSLSLAVALTSYIVFCFACWCDRGGARGPRFLPRPGERPFPPDDDGFPPRVPPFGTFY